VKGMSEEYRGAVEHPVTRCSSNGQIMHEKRKRLGLMGKQSEYAKYTTGKNNVTDTDNTKEKRAEDTALDAPRGTVGAGNRES